MNLLIVIAILAIFFTVNMGGASFAASFAAGYGGKIISRKHAGILFLLFVTLGAVVYGHPVSRTLGNEIIPPGLITHRVMIVIFLSAGLSMFAANLMKIPQSTSLVTVASIAGVGLFFQQLNLKTIYFLIPFWVILPVLSFLITYGAASYVYPPRKSNFWIYEKLVNHQGRLRKFVVICGCYNAFSVGTNNVANVVGPLMGSGTLDIHLGLLIFACLYGAGAFIFLGPLKTAGNKIVPLGLLTASIISLVSGTLMIMASGLGIPQSFVMLQMGSLFAIAVLKNGKDLIFGDAVTKRILFTWTVNPIITLIVSYGLSFLLLKR